MREDQDLLEDRLEDLEEEVEEEAVDMVVEEAGMVTDTGEEGVIDTEEAGEGMMIDMEEAEEGTEATVERGKGAGAAPSPGAPGMTADAPVQDPEAAPGLVEIKTTFFSEARTRCLAKIKLGFSLKVN